MKWEPVAAMILLLGLGFLLAREPHTPGLRPNAITQKIQLGSEKGVLERAPLPSGDYSYRFVFRDGSASQEMSESELTQVLPPSIVSDITRDIARRSENWIFRKLNITSWAGVAWVAFGFLGQAAFTGRMLLQWFVSERKKQSVITVGFWWMSLIGGAILFSYFVWRQDIVGVLGQSSGVVIYARNIRLHYKQRRREARQAERENRRNAAGDASPSAPGAAPLIETRPASQTPTSTPTA